MMRRQFVKMAGLGVTLGARAWAGSEGEPAIDSRFFVRPEELTLKLSHSGAERRLSFARHVGPAETWRRVCREKLAELRAIYKAFGAEDRISLRVTPDAWHEMDNPDLQAFLAS